MSFRGTERNAEEGAVVAFGKLYFLGGVSSDFVYPKDEAVAAGMRLRLSPEPNPLLRRNTKTVPPPSN